MPDLAHGLAHVPRSVGLSPDEPAVTAGHADCRTGGDDVGAGKLPRADRIAQIDGERARRAEIAHGGDAGLERAARVLRARIGTLGGIRLDEDAHRVRLAAAFEMGVRVDETGNEATRLDDPRTLGERHLGIADGRDTLALDHDDAVGARLTQVVVQLSKADRERVRHHPTSLSTR